MSTEANGQFLYQKAPVASRHWTHTGSMRCVASMLSSFCSHAAHKWEPRVHTAAPRYWMSFNYSLRSLVPWYCLCLGTMPHRCCSMCVQFVVQMMACIGEQFTEGDEICGIVVNVRARQDRLCMWTKTASNEAAQARALHLYVCLVDLCLL